MKQGGIEVDVVNLRGSAKASAADEIVGWRAGRRLARARNDSSAVFLHYSGSTNLRKTLHLVAAASVIKRRNLVLFQHNGAYDRVLASRQPSGAIHRWLVRRAALVMCLSEALETATRDADRLARCVRCVSFVVSPTLAALRERAAAEPKSAGRVVTSGYRTPNYRYEEVIEAVRLVRNARPQTVLDLYCYGATDEKYWQGITELARKESWIAIHHDVPETAWLRELQRSSLYVRNTEHDSYGVAVAEALYLGIPAMATEVCDRTPGTLLYQAGDQPALLAGMLELLALPEERKLHDVADAMHGYATALGLLERA